MDTYDEELVALWRSFAKYGLSYIMVGGFAVNLHGFNRTTADIDIWIKDTTKNRGALRKVLIDIGYPDLPQIQTIDFVPGWTTFYLSAGLELDVMTFLSGFEQDTFDDCFKYASIAHIFELEIPFLHINQLLEEKRKTNRPKDQIDVIELEKIKKQRETP